MERPIYAWQAAPDVLVLACPSSRRGVYLVAAGPAGNGRDLVVMHECPAARARKFCWHVIAAIDAYRAWRPEKRFSGLVTRVRRVTLNRAWKQIPVPGAVKTAEVSTA